MANLTEDGLSYVYNEIVKIVPDSFMLYASDFEYHPWLFAFFGSLLVGLSGILPLLIIPIDDKEGDVNSADSPSLKVLLSFAVGALLGDVFLHLLPEAWHHAQMNTPANEHVSMKCGLCVLGGLLLFIIVEKIFSDTSSKAEEEEVEKKEFEPKPSKPLEIEDIHRLINAEKTKREKSSGGIQNGGAVLCDDGEDEMYDSCLLNNNGDGSGGSCGHNIDGSNVCGSSLKNGVLRGKCLKGNWWKRAMLENQAEAAKVATNDTQKDGKIHISGYLNLMANSIDNFTHGLAVGGSFLISFRVGILSTFAILVHEIPHEVGDFAILLRSGFSRWDAAKAQLATATAGLVGAMTAVICSGASSTLEAKTSWILPFTAGGFLHIALITVLPDLLKEEDKMESIKQLLALISGIAIMGTLTALVD